MIAALLPNVTNDHMLSAVGSWASPLLRNPYVLMAGTPSDIEMINGVEYLFAQGLLRPGDRLGALYLEGEYGANVLAGAKYVADQLGLELKEAKITATTTDMTSAIVQFKAAGVKAITLTTSSAQTASALNVAAQSMPDTKFIANSAAFVPGLLNTNAPPRSSATCSSRGRHFPSRRRRQKWQSCVRPSSARTHRRVAVPA